MYTCGLCGALTETPYKYPTEQAGQTIPICNNCHENLEKAYDYQSENEHWHETTVICPHCNYDYDSYDSYTDFEPDDEHEKVICPKCGKAFELEVEEVRYFSTKKHLCEMPKEESEAT